MPTDLEVGFEGAVWKLNPDVVQRLVFFASVLEDVPEMNTLVNGMLLTDFLSTVKAYFWCVLLAYGLLTIGLGYGILLIGLVLYLVPSVLSPVLQSREVPKCSTEFRNAVILYFTARRIIVCRSAGAIYRFVIIMGAVLVAFPWSLLILLPLMISSLLINTEKIVNTMAIK
jgi:hypothetical protein